MKVTDDSLQVELLIVLRLRYLLVDVISRFYMLQSDLASRT